MCLAQLDRAFGYGPKGRGFESSSTRLKHLYSVGAFLFHEKFLWISYEIKKNLALQDPLVNQQYSDCAPAHPEHQILAEFSAVHLKPVTLVLLKQIFLF